MAIVEYVNKREDEDGQENQRQYEGSSSQEEQEEDQQANILVIFHLVEFSRSRIKTTSLEISVESERRCQKRIPRVGSYAP
jgi:hypothetical protein